MALVRHILRGYSYVFEGILSLGALGLGLLGAFSQNASMHIGWLPFESHNVVRWLVGVGLVGLLCVLLAVLGRLRSLLFIFALASTVILVKGCFLGSYTFSGPHEAKSAAVLVAGSMLALLGSVPWVAPQRLRR